MGEFWAPGAEIWLFKKKNIDRSIDLAVWHICCYFESLCPNHLRSSTWKIPRSWQRNPSWCLSAKFWPPGCCSCLCQHLPTASQCEGCKIAFHKLAQHLIYQNWSNLDKSLLGLLDNITGANILNDADLQWKLLNGTLSYIQTSLNY